MLKVDYLTETTQSPTSSSTRGPFYGVPYWGQVTPFVFVSLFLAS